ncbi:hypothetical protein M885DRAFT_452177 [Pelagophyceae sp. CCMP2097]|nr:hypothetical protein M885DRAFT_452177 [Pelagophyceae sp. CCMP2097]
MPGIVDALLRQGHLEAVEPHLDAILERLDDIEPHMTWILRNVDDLAPHCGPLMRHIDELLLYADEDHEWADKFVPVLSFYVSRLDALGPHLALLRPHIACLAPHVRTLMPAIDRLFRPGSSEALLVVSANADILLFYFGWAMRIPLAPRLFLRAPGAVGVLRFAARRLPRRFVRNHCCDVECDVASAGYGAGWNRSTPCES